MFWKLRKPIFSPDSGGNMKPNTLQTVTIKLGNMKLNEKNNVRLLKCKVTVNMEYFPPSPSNTSSVTTWLVSK